MALYSDQTYEVILERILNRVSPKFDKREGSIIYDSSGPMSVELAQMYIGLDYILECAFIDTAPREWLVKLAIERGLSPDPATAAVGIGTFNMDVPIGTRFSLDIYNWKVTEKIEDLKYYLTCETNGATPNAYTGALIPIDYINGLTSATLVSIAIPGEDEEDTEVFRQRVIDSFSYQAFGGNKADYKTKVKGIAGVGAVKVYPTWNKDLAPATLTPPSSVAAWFSALENVPAEIKSWFDAICIAAENKLLTVGGAVKLVVLDSTYAVPTQTLIDTVQTTMDPAENAGEGVGLAPIGHVVTVKGVTNTTVNINFGTVDYTTGWTWATVKPYAEKIIDDYLLSLSKTWEDTANIIVRISKIESLMLTCNGIVDLGNTKINGFAENLSLGENSIPLKGTVTAEVD